MSISKWLNRLQQRRCSFLKIVQLKSIRKQSAIIKENKSLIRNVIFGKAIKVTHKKTLL